jgi:hypothetical protein
MSDNGSMVHNTTYIIQQFNELRMLIRDVFLHKRCSLEQLLAGLTAKLAFIFLFYVWLGDF